MKIIVTGGAGFIGSHLCERLLNDDHEVLCIDNLITGSDDNIKNFKSNKKFTFINHDVIEPLPTGIQADVMYHLASPASPNHHSKLSYHALPMETMLVNTRGTLQLARWAAKNKARFLFSSSSEVYGDPKVHPQTELYFGNVSPIGPRSVYDEAKRFGETITAHFARNGADTRIARIFNTYGPRMRKDDMRMIVTFINQALVGAPITVFGDGRQTRALCFIDDMIAGLVKLMMTDQAKGQVVNLGSPDEHTVLEYANLVKKLTGSKSEIKLSEKLPENDPLKRRPDITRAKQLLNWEPKTSLEGGLGIMIDYFKTQ
jgi:dTDP-glucose 4,6-dehydratase/UDP-glucuronate decarboxylase